MSETVKNPKVKDCCHANNRLQDLQMLFEGLERCQKSLNDYLDSKRNAFPRLLKDYIELLKGFIFYYRLFKLSVYKCIAW